MIGSAAPMQRAVVEAVVYGEGNLRSIRLIGEDSRLLDAQRAVPSAWRCRSGAGLCRSEDGNPRGPHGDFVKSDLRGHAQYPLVMRVSADGAFARSLLERSARIRGIRCSPGGPRNPTRFA